MGIRVSGGATPTVFSFVVEVVFLLAATRRAGNRAQWQMRHQRSQLHRSSTCITVADTGSCAHVDSCVTFVQPQNQDTGFMHLLNVDIRQYSSKNTQVWKHNQCECEYVLFSISSLFIYGGCELTDRTKRCPTK